MISENKSFEHIQGTISVKKRGWFRRLFAFIGPAYLISVGYMDPGNWGTDIEGGARFGYTLIWVLLMSNLMAIIIQTLSARLGIVTGYDLAQGCRLEYPRPINIFLWFLAEIAIAATDLAEAIGTIIALNLLFKLPLIWGCVVTALDTFLLLAIQKFGIRKMEAFIVMFIFIIGFSLVIEVFLAKPEIVEIARGFVPHLEPNALYVAIGIIGATVMPHNIYLYSSLVQSRKISNTLTGKAEANKFNLIDSIVALNIAFIINTAIMVMAAANFHSRGIIVTEIQQAHSLLEPILGVNIAPIAFGVALLAAGQSSTITGTLSGQIVMEGFLNIRIRPWLRRLITRSLALIPAVIVIALTGDKGTYKLLILSQVILSLQLPFAIIPLIHFTSDRKKMGIFVNKWWIKVLVWFITLVIGLLNIKLVLNSLTDWLARGSYWIWPVAIFIIIILIGILLYIIIIPFFRAGKVWESEITTISHNVAGLIKPVKIKRIGVALEHIKGDFEIISMALTMAKHHNASLTLLHVVNTPGTIIYGRDSQSRHSTEDEAYLEGLAREIEEHNLSVETMLCFGNPAEEIIKSVNEADLDMLVLGSHGHRGIEDLIHGQTVESVRHAVKIPVVVVRISGTEQAQHKV